MEHFTSFEVLRDKKMNNFVIEGYTYEVVRAGVGYIYSDKEIIDLDPHTLCFVLDFAHTYGYKELHVRLFYN